MNEAPCFCVRRGWRNGHEWCEEMVPDFNCPAHGSALRYAAGIGTKEQDFEDDILMECEAVWGSPSGHYVFSLPIDEADKPPALLPPDDSVRGFRSIIPWTIYLWKYYRRQDG